MKAEIIGDGRHWTVNLTPENDSDESTLRDIGFEWKDHQIKSKGFSYKSPIVTFLVSPIPRGGNSDPY